MKAPSVLLVCTGNTARSQMAQVRPGQHGGARFQGMSAGLEPDEVHPLTRQVLTQQGCSADHLGARGATPVLGQQFTVVITVCDRPEQKCAVFPFALRREAWPFEDPAAAPGSEEEQRVGFRRVRDRVGA